MNTTVETSSINPAQAEEYGQAMNLIGQNLMAALVQSMNKIPAHCRNQRVVSQAVSAFLANIIYQQFPGNNDSCQQMLQEINQLVKIQLETIPS